MKNMCIEAIIWTDLIWNIRIVDYVTSIYTDSLAR